MPTPEPYRELLANLNASVACPCGCLDAATDPENVFAEQCRAVSGAVREFDQDDPAILSDMLDLPLWSVRRCLAELGLTPAMAERPKYAKKETALDKLVALLSDGRKRTYQGMAMNLCCTVSHVANTIRDNPTLFVRHRDVDPSSRERLSWTLAKEKPT